jgi:hypothetical protein
MLKPILCPSSPLLLLCALGWAALPAHAQVRNLASEAVATASEHQDDFTAEKAIDGERATRWSGIPGHNQGVWFELEWKAPVTIAEVVLHQFDRFVIELDVQGWDPTTNEWHTLAHLGSPDRRLPLVAVARFEAMSTSKLRIGNITNGPSFTEVEVYSAPVAHGLVTTVASDLRGNLTGMVCDSFGSSAVAGAKVQLSGRLAQRAETWSASAQSGETGEFHVALPFGLTGKIAIETEFKGAQHSFELEASALQRALTPRDEGAHAQALDQGWRFAGDPPQGFEAPGFDDRAWAPIQVPSHWEMQGFHPLGGVGGYRLRFSPPTGSGRVLLSFDGVYSGATVWVNGSLAASHEGGFTPFECDVTDLVHAGDNLLALRVLEHTATSDTLDQMSSYADFPLGGIMRRVWLWRTSELHVEALELATDSRLQGTIAVLDAGPQAARGVTVRLSLSNEDGRRELGTLPAFDLAPWTRAELPFAFDPGRPKRWDPEHPNLYTLTLELRAGDKVVQTLAQRIGFRETKVEGQTLLVNGAPVKIRGTCHHDQDPLAGRAVSAALERRDLELIKAANMNALRTSHYPPLPELVSIADELGLFVEDEASFCWVGVSDDLRLAPRVLQLTAELVARDRNHPSVCMWSLCNESGFGRDFELARDWVHAVDPSRPLGAATSAWLDIATAHNPISVARIAEYEAQPAPMLFDESFAPFQGIWSDAGELWIDPGIRDDYVTPLRPIWDAMMKSRATQGSQIWAWSDDLFLVPGRGLEYGRRSTPVHFVENSYAMPGRGIVGDAPWGLVDGWRRPKPEYWIVRKLHSPVRVEESPIPVPQAGEPLRIEAENQYDFTDLRELRIAWALGAQHGELAPQASIAPHTRGTLVIATPRAPRAGEVLELAFVSARGAPIDEFRVPIGNRVAPEAPVEHAPGVALALREENTLAGHATRVIGASFELALDRDSGLLRRAVAFGEPVLVELPSLHLLVSSKPLADLPDRSTWHTKRTDVRLDGERAIIEVEGSYEHFDGRYELAIEPSGVITSTARFRYDGPELFAREIGQRLALPREFDTLDWSRRAEWGVYPSDHIGRPVGHARASYAHAYARPPTWPWSQDDSPLGSNDFRSTKRHVDWAVLSRAGGTALELVGQGEQSARVIVEPDRVALFALDFYGGTGARLFEWENNYGRGRNLKTGATIESVVRLEFARVRR